jgi:PKD repeat protein
MRQTDRRAVLRAAGVGAVGSLGGTAAAQSSGATDESVVTTFTLRGQDGFIALDQAPPSPEKRFGLSGPDGVENWVRIEGEVYEDGTWESTSVQLPTLAVPDRVLREARLPASLDIPVVFDPVDTPYTGEIVRTEGRERLTLDGSFEVTVDLPPDLSSTDPEPTRIDLNATTGVSRNLEGQVIDDTNGLDFQGREAGVKLVDNEFVNDRQTLGRPAAGTEVVREIPFELPSTQPGYNWFQLEGTISFADPVGPPIRPGPPEPNPPSDPDDDGLYEDVTGDGEFNILDVQTLFMNLDTPELQNTSEKFNFSGLDPDRVTILDVQALYHELRS